MKLLISLAILSSVTPGLGQAAGECCPPSQLQGTAAFRGLVLKEEGADPYSGYSNIYHDEKRGKYVKDVKAEFEKAGPMTLFVLEDYAGGKRYTVVNGNCSVESLKGDFNRELCVNQSNFKGNINIGLDPSGLTMSLFGVNYSNPRYEIYGEAMVQQISAKRCLMQTEMVTVRKNSELFAMESGIVFNATASISNPAIFDIPKACKMASASRTNIRFASRFGVYLHGLNIKF
uniref:Uncharacterized protein LOC111133680 n=1 Tax=Crassostrea virginica TaxID=6565 RepID=A0A8B8EEI6_CRAVI|nr:uncharacterized protein LOC111133680 [Crassostrea virginica]